MPAIPPDFPSESSSPVGTPVLPIQHARRAGDRPVRSLKALKPTNSAVFDVKSASIGALGLVLKCADMGKIAHALEERFIDAAGENTPILIDLSRLTDDEALEGLELNMLLSMVRKLGLQPVGMVGARGIMLESGRVLGLSEESDIGHVIRRPAPEPRVAPAMAPHGIALEGGGFTQAQMDEALRQQRSTIEQQLHIAYKQAQQTEIDAALKIQSAGMVNPPMVIDKPVRSGQKIYAKNADIIVLSIVSPGAEVAADGNIHVYGPLRGRAMAGICGNKDARIFAMAMEPHLFSIAGVYGTTDTPLPENVRGKPAMVRLEGDRLVVEPVDLQAPSAFPA